jgi:hypothetical protein
MAYMPLGWAQSTRTTSSSSTLKPLKPATAVSQNTSNPGYGYGSNYNNANSGSYTQPGAYTTPNSGSSYGNNYGGYGASGYGATPYSNGPANMAPLQGRVVTAPAGTTLSATPNMAISSETARVGDRFMASLGSDLSAGGSVVVPAGSQLEGQVVSVAKASRGGRHGTLDVQFTTAVLPNGQRVPISGRIQTSDGSGVIKGGTVKSVVGNAALRTAVGAGLGAALGTAMGPLSGGRVGKGAIYGTAVGGGLGAANAVWDKGTEALINAGQALNIVLQQPVTVSAPAAGYMPSMQPQAMPNNSYGNYGNTGNSSYYGN